MSKYLLIHTIDSSETKRIFENYLLGLTHILHSVSEKDYYSYEFESNIKKNDLIQLLDSFVKNLSLNKCERVVLYDTEIWPDPFEMPSNNEKIILNGDIEIENKVEKIIIKLFRYIKMKKALDKAEKRYFDSLIVKQN